KAHRFLTSAQKSWAVGRITISSISTPGGCSIAYAIAFATELAGIAILQNSRKFLLVASSELLSGSSVATAPGEIIVQRIFWECSSIRSPSVNVRTAALVAQ